MKNVARRSQQSKQPKVDPSSAQRRDETARRLTAAVDLTSAPTTAGGERLAARVEVFERAMLDPVALAIQQLDELEIVVKCARAALLADHAKAAEVISAASFSKRIFFDQPSDSPTAIAARLMTCIDHVMQHSFDVAYGSTNEDDVAMFDAARILERNTNSPRLAFARLVRLKFAEFFPEHATRLSIPSLNKMFAACVPGITEGSKWNDLADLCKNDLQITVKADEAQRAKQKISSKNSGK